MHRVLISPDIRPILKPDTGYPVHSGYRISGRIFKSIFKCVVKYEISEDIRCIEGFLFPFVTYGNFLHQSNYDVKKTFLEFSDRYGYSVPICPDIGYFQYPVPVSGRIFDKSNPVWAGYRCRISYKAGYLVHP
jgi:hypothetical protein